MSARDVYILIAIVVLLVVAIVAFVLGRREPHNRVSPLAGLAFGFVIAGILFGENRLVGFTMLGIGAVLAVIDIFRKRK